MSQFLIDFGEDRMFGAQDLCQKRAGKYGDRSWQWRWTFWQERIWDKFQRWALKL